MIFNDMLVGCGKNGSFLVYLLEVDIDIVFWISNLVVFSEIEYIGII